MNCPKHPQNVAIASCPLCRRNICEECRVNVMSMPHCKECAEWLIFQTMSRYRKPTPLPMPIGEPRRNFFIWGGIGSIILMIAAACIGIFVLNENTPFPEYPWWFVLWSGIFSIGLIVTSIGFYGFFRNYGSTMGLITYVILIISSFIFILSVIFSIHYNDHRGDWGFGLEESYSIGGELIAAIEIVGLCLALMGATLVLLRRHIMAEDMPLTIGIFHIILAGLFALVILAWPIGIAWILLAVACFLLALVFFSAKLPPRFIGHVPTQAQAPKPLGWSLP